MTLRVLLLTCIFSVVMPGLPAEIKSLPQSNHIGLKEESEDIINFDQSEEGSSEVPDWLVTNITYPTRLTKTLAGTLVLSNGLISRHFSIEPDFTTIDYYSHEKQSSLLRALSPEATIHIDGTMYYAGLVQADIPRAYLNRSALLNNMKKDPNAFQYVGHATHAVEAPYPYKPRRVAPTSIVWPPKGLRLDGNFCAPPSAPGNHHIVYVTVHYEMYDGIPLMSKWVSITGTLMIQGIVSVGVSSVEYLSVNNQWGSAVWGGNDQQDYYFYQGSRWLYVQTDQSHGTVVDWDVDPAASLMPGSFQPIVNVSYQILPSIPLPTEGFVSFRVHELAIGSDDLERQALARHRMLRLLAPQTQENPIFFHMVNSSSRAVRGVIDQLAEVGFEMMIYSFGSGFEIESTNETYLKQMKSDIAYANSKGIEVGGYDLICWSRKVKAEWEAINPITGEPRGSACFASG